MTTVKKYTIELDNNADEFEFEWASEGLDSLFEESNVSDFHISTEAMNWNGVSGYTVVGAGSVVDTLKVNGDYRLVFHIDPSTPDHYTVLRYSHDEPCGARFEVRPATEKESAEFF